MKLYIDSIKKLKILKSKKPNVKWASSEDILHWYPCFPFVAHINKNRMTYDGLEYYNIEEKKKIIAETNSFFNFHRQLEIE
jgi:hypothetical protein